MLTPRLMLLALLFGAPALAQEQVGMPVVAVQVGAEAAEDAAAAAAPSLDDLRWIARPLVIFADTPNDPLFQQQLGMLRQRQDELADRDVVILTDTDPAARGPLRQQLRPRGFGLVLIDLDGTVAQRRPDPTAARDLINLIDRMPSRREGTRSRRP